MSAERTSWRELELTSTANPRVRTLLGLRRRRDREQAGLTIVAAGSRPREIYHCPELSTPGGADEQLLARAAALGARIIRVNRRVFEKIAYREGPDGWLAVVPAVDTRLDRLQPGPEPLLLVCEAVEKPGNLGAMLRTADAAGLAGVIAVDPVADWGNPNIVRASKGTVFSVPVAAATGAQALEWLRDHGIGLVATTPDAERLYTDVDLRGPVAVAVGTEKHGLSPAWLAAATHRVRIPMRGRIDSLNVATAAALVVYEALRQRGAGDGGDRAVPRATP
jgi:TrmH family RNA methyltransferase